MDQGQLFETNFEPVQPGKDVIAQSPSQDVELARVRSKLAEPILAFCSGRTEFFMTELYRYVSSQVECAPGSVDRILRALRKSGQIDYEVISRRKSHYRITG